MGKPPVKSPRKRVLTISRPNGTRPRPQTAPTGAAVAGSSGNMKVVVRVRPPNTKEQGDNAKIVVKIVDEQLMVFDPAEEDRPFFYHGVQHRGRDLLKKANKNMQFIFDRVFGFDSSNEQVFEHSTQGLIDSLMDGCNCSIFVYGATGAGKTHTMLGHNRHPGIMFLTMNELFRVKEKLAAERDFELAVSYLEVYNENVQDLLKPGTPLHLREDGKYGVVVAGIQVKQITEPSELFDLLEKGNKNRTQHPTDANAESSRSHAVFQVYLRMNIKTTGQVRVAKLSMIDLAGSERGAATGCAGARFTEGANINKSLLALGNCINSLADGQRHVPYRDSKLTRLLKDSLGGNCQTVMIANISPSSLSFEDSYNTLKYATRAKKIKSNVKKNVVDCKLHITQYVKMVDELQKEVEKLKSQLKERKEDSSNKFLCNACGGGAGDGVKPIVSSTVVQPVTPTILVSKPLVDPVKKVSLCEIYKELAEVQKVLLDLQTTIKVLELQKEMKKEDEDQLKTLCITSEEERKGHIRTDAGIDRIEKQVLSVKVDVEKHQQKFNDLQQEIDKIVADSPELKEYSMAETEKSNLLESKHKHSEQEQLYNIVNSESEKRSHLIKRMAETLKKCYLLVVASGEAPEYLVKDYKNLLRQVQNIESVTFDPPNIGMSPLNSTMILSTPAFERKRKLEEEESSLNNTFVLPGSKETFLAKGNSAPPLKKSTATVRSMKAYEPPAKRSATVRSASPFIGRENRPNGKTQKLVVSGPKRGILKKKPLSPKNQVWK